jgi:hypothetical protein
VLAKMGVNRNTAIKYIGKTWKCALIENRPSLRRRDLREQRRKQERGDE